MDRDVHVSDGTRDLSWKQAIPKPTIPILTLPMFYWFMVVPTLSFHGSLMVGRTLGASSVVSLTAGAVICVAAVIPLLRWIIGMHRLCGSHELRPVTREDDRHRLRLLTTLKKQSIDPLSDDGWEPVVVPLRFALPDRKGWAITAWIVLVLVLMVAGFWFRVAIVKSGIPFNGLDVWTVLAAASVPFMWLWPAYLRIAPGRVDVLRYGFLGMGRVRCRSVDVRDAKVRIVSGMGGHLHIEPRDGERVTIPLMHVRPQALVRPVFMAARWRGELPKLPEDALLG